ncbi:hypothetical protein M3P21_21550 [Ruegeria sp. 2012CJ41-6]|uniref:Carboxymuconolactone decarboxylase family protein n=1 Tax=Ruegeria spongiae TaxID=2942209 RepID=A0ABT0Q8C0_9RHOB|nr:hypothetical protein [Ruegeria spongiae]MCL6286100.1 hypothetical protein [Ruegeria spongiae]
MSDMQFDPSKQADAMCWLSADRSPEDYLSSEEQDQLCREDGSVHRLYQAFSDWPAPILPAHKFYQAVLHTPDSPLDFNTCEFIATFVAILASCDYARAHHGENFINTSNSRADGQKILSALEAGDLQAEVIKPLFRQLAVFTKKLSLTPEEMTQEDIHELKSAGLTDAQISQACQVAASFAYWVRIINGLGISLGKERIGLGQKGLQKVSRTTVANVSPGREGG